MMIEEVTAAGGQGGIGARGGGSHGTTHGATASGGGWGVNIKYVWATHVLNTRQHRERSDWELIPLDGVGYEGAVVLLFWEAFAVACSYELAVDADYRAAVEWLESEINGTWPTWNTDGPGVASGPTGLAIGGKGGGGPYGGRGGNACVIGGGVAIGGAGGRGYTPEE